jgi:acyl carrier protein
MSVINLQQDLADQTQTIPAELSAGTVPRLRTATEIQIRLVEEVARLLEAEPQVIDVVEPFDRYGLDSMMAVNLTAVLEEWLGRDFSPTLPYEYPTIQSLSQHLADQLGAAR